MLLKLSQSRLQPQSSGDTHSVTSSASSDSVIALSDLLSLLQMCYL